MRERKRESETEEERERESKRERESRNEAVHTPKTQNLEGPNLYGDTGIRHQ